MDKTYWGRKRILLGSKGFRSQYSKRGDGELSGVGLESLWAGIFMAYDKKIE